MRRSKSLYFSKIARASSMSLPEFEHGERAFAKQRVQAALARVEQLGDFLLGEVLEAALRGDPGVDHVGR